MKTHKAASLSLAFLMSFAFANAANDLSSIFGTPVEQEEYPRPESPPDLIRDQFDKASKVTLGTKEDVKLVEEEVIKHLREVICKRMKLEGLKFYTGEMRWVSADVVMADSMWYLGPLASAKYLYVLKKNKEKWEIQNFYITAIS
jgi:hypothetical protein